MEKTLTNIALEVEKYDMENAPFDEPIASVRTAEDVEPSAEVILWDNKRLVEGDPMSGGWEEGAQPRFTAVINTEEEFDAAGCRAMAVVLLKAADELDDFETEALAVSFGCLGAK